MGKHLKNTPPGEYQIGYKRVPPPQKNEVRNKWGRAGKPRDLAAESMAGALRRHLSKPVDVTRAGRPLKISAWEKVIRRLAKDVLGGDTKAMVEFVQMVERNGWFDKPEETQKVGLLVLYPPCRTTDEWLEKSKGIVMPLNPLEGIPGLQPELLRHEKRVFKDGDI